MFNVVPVFLTQHLIARKTRKRQILLGLFQKSNITKLVGSLKIYTMRTVDVFITVSTLASDSCYKTGNVEVRPMSQSSLSSSMGSSPKRSRRRFSRLRSLAL